MDTPGHNDEAESPKLSENPARRLTRFLVAVCTAFVVAFFMLLFMRYLVGGFDDSASDTLTRYISLPSITIHRRSEEVFKPVKPRLEPAYDLLDPMADDAGSLEDEESALQIGEIPVVETGIELLAPPPALGNNSDDDREKMRRIKEALVPDNSN